MYIASYILSKKEHPGTTSTLKIFAPVGICAISVFIINSFCILCVNISLSTKYGYTYTYKCNGSFVP